MKSRRSFLAVVAGASLAGCSNLEHLRTAETTETKTDWYKVHSPNPEVTAEPEWKGGAHSTQSQGTSIYTDGARITIPLAYANPLLGVNFDEPVDGNPEEIPDEEFEWVVASEHSYIWTPFVEIASEDRDYRVELENIPEEIPVENWTATADLRDEEAPSVLPLATGFSESPTYYRIITQSGTRTTPAYTYSETARGGRYLAFELAERWVYIAYDGEVRADWAFDL